MKMAQVVHRCFQYHSHAFVSELYRQLLNREPDANGLAHFTKLLNTGTSRKKVFATILESSEAMNLFLQHPNTTTEDTSIFVEKARELLSMPHEAFVKKLYEEVLCREPDSAGVASHLSSLKQGIAPYSLFKFFFTCDEFKSLIRMERRLFAKKVVDHFIRTLD